MADYKELLSKVAKLRALAARAGTQAEAEAAAAQADAIIAKYRLAEADLEAAGDAPSEACERDTDPLDTNVSAGWLGILAAGLARHYGCFVYRHTGGPRWDAALGRTVETPTSFPIFGRRSDVEILRYMYAWLKLEIERLAQFEKGRANKNAFRLGAASGFIAALRASTRAEVARHAGGSGAMVLVSRSEEAEKLARNGVRLRGSGKVYSKGDLSARQRGEAAGAHLHGSQRKIGAGGRLLGS